MRSEVSEIDDTRSIVLDGFSVPALKTSYVDTGVEMKAGQSLALAGLVQTRVEAIERGLPFLGDLPYVGAAFRKVEEEVNEIELLILVTPELADGLDPCEVPPCGPGMESVSPTNCQLYFGSHLEVPSCGPCGPGCYGGDCGYSSSGCAKASSSTSYVSDEPATGVNSATPSLALPMQNSYDGEPVEAIPSYEGLLQGGSSPAIGQGASGYPADMRETQQPQYQMPPQYTRENPQDRTSYQLPRTSTSTPGLIGPIGYDMEK